MFFGLPTVVVTGALWLGGMGVVVLCGHFLIDLPILLQNASELLGCAGPCLDG